ncbi:MAG: Ger(x)C family spore germination protein [Tissierellaceae bacterium]|nr:Ger(x)C family spore germination protein [Tissierellaceae bacterium]
MKRIIILFLIISIALLSGCWDMEEINNRSYVSVIGMDLNNKGDNGEKFKVTYSYPNINALGKNPSSEQNRFIETTSASTAYEATRKLSTSTDKPLFFKNLKTLVIGEELFKEKELVKEILDGLGREQRINRKINILLAEGKAEDILKITPEKETASAVGTYLSDILRNDKITGRFTAKTLSQVLIDSDIANAALVPKIKIEKKDLEISGGGIIKDYKLIGKIGEMENICIAMMNGDFNSDVIEATYNDTHISYAVTIFSSSKRVYVEGGKIIADIDLNIEGYLQQYKLDKELQAFDEKFLQGAEKSLEDRIKRETLNTIELIQKKYNADVIGIGEWISKFKPSLWKEIKDNYDEVFPNIEIRINPTVEIRRTGLSR